MDIGIFYKDETFEGWSVSAYLEKQDANEYLIDGVLPKNSHAMIYAPTGHMKSFMAIHLGCCVATGTPFNKQAIEQGEVVYIAAEAPREIAKRIKAWQDFNGYEDDVIKFFPTTVRFKQPDSVAKLDRYIESRKGAVKLVIFDTAARCASGVDEDSNSEVQQIVNDTLTDLKDRHNLTVLVLHHTGKDGLTPRGAAAWQDACDTFARVETVFENKSRLENPLITTLVTEKLRGDKPISVAFRPAKKNSTLVLTAATLDEAAALKPKQGRPRKDTSPRNDGTPRVRGREKKQNVRAAIVLCVEEGITTAKGMAEKTGIPEKTIKNNLTLLRNCNVLYNENGEWLKAS